MSIEALKALRIKQQEELLETAKSFLSDIKDTNGLSLGVRWNMFGTLSNISGLMPRDSWVCNSIDPYNLNWYDDFYIERYQDCDYYDLTDAWEGFVEEGKVTQEQYDAWRESILAAGKVGFRYDW